MKELDDRSVMEDALIEVLRRNILYLGQEFTVHHLRYQEVRGSVVARHIVSSVMDAPASE